MSRIFFPEGQVDPRTRPYRDWTLVAPDHIESFTGRLIDRKTAEQGSQGRGFFWVTNSKKRLRVLISPEQLAPECDTISRSCAGPVPSVIELAVGLRQICKRHRRPCPNTCPAQTYQQLSPEQRWRSLPKLSHPIVPAQCRQPGHRAHAAMEHTSSGPHLAEARCLPMPYQTFYSWGKNRLTL